MEEGHSGKCEDESPSFDFEGCEGERDWAWAAFFGCLEEFPGCSSSHMKQFVASRVVDNGCSSGFVSVAKSVPEGVVWRYKFLWPLLDY
ncbi:hypothetical protein ACFX12_043614 [Malus domestica]